MLCQVNFLDVDHYPSIQNFRRLDIALATFFDINKIWPSYSCATDFVQLRQFKQLYLVIIVRQQFSTFAVILK